jgi:hypothetical protein
MIMTKLNQLTKDEVIDIIGTIIVGAVILALMMI